MFLLCLLKSFDAAHIKIFADDKRCMVTLSELHSRGSLSVLWGFNAFDPVHPVFTWKASVCGCGAGVKYSLWANNKLTVRKEKLESWWDKQSSQTHSSRIIFTDNSGPCDQHLLANNTHTQEEERACLPCVIPHGNPFDFFTLPGKVPRGRNTLITWLYPLRKR